MGYAKKYQLIKAAVNSPKTINLDGKEITLSDKTGACDLVDGGVAKEIEARYGRHGEVRPGQFITVPIHNAGMVPGHKRTFTVPSLPWKDEQNAISE